LPTDKYGLQPLEYLRQNRYFWHFKSNDRLHTSSKLYFQVYLSAIALVKKDKKGCKGLNTLYNTHSLLGR
jgi:hypothetical protein